MASGFHAFTFKQQVYSGVVSDYAENDGIVQFTFGYASDGAAVSGSFTGERLDSGEVLGAWKEVSNKPIDGESSWQGEARLTVAAAGPRIVLHGSWAMSGVKDERWIGEVD